MINLGDDTLIIIFITKHAFLFETINQSHIKNSRKSLRRFSGNGICIRIQHIPLSVMRQRCHHRNHSFMNQIRKQCGIYLLYIPDKSIIDLFYGALHRTDYIHIRSGQPQGIDPTGLQSGYNILVYQPTIDHCHNLQCLRIGYTASIDHFTVNPQ